MSKTGVFKARFAFDYLKIEPLVFEYLEQKAYPSLAVSSQVEDYVRESLTDEELRWIDKDRLKHDISRALGRVGYKKRSKRGKAWDAVRGWCIRQADVRKKVSNPAWKQPRTGLDADFVQADIHPVKSPKGRSVHHSSCNLVLCTFFSLY